MSEKIQKVAEQSKTENWETLIWALGEASKVSFSLVFFPIVFLLLGVFADKRFSSSPLFLVIGIASGVFLGFNQALRIKKKGIKKQ